MTKHERILTMLGLLEHQPLSLNDLSVMLKSTKDCIRAWLYDLEFAGVVRSSLRNTGYRGMASTERVIHLVDKSKYQKKERKPYPIRNQYSSPYNSEFPLPKGGKIYRNLDKPEPPRELRKINTAWMGYQSGLELA